MLVQLLVLAASATTAFAAQPAYAQCGGENFTGGTTCVSGYTCKYQNPYYSQCVPSSQGTSTHHTHSKHHSSCSEDTSTASATKASATKASTTKAVTTTTAPKPTTTAAKSTSTSPAKSTSTLGSSSSGSSSGKSYKASFTEYGSGDQNGSGNCNVATTACGFYTSPGYSAAVSQNEFGVGPVSHQPNSTIPTTPLTLLEQGAGAGPACGTCWQLTIETDSSGNSVANAGKSIVVQVTNLCPADGNPLCSQNGLSGTNQYGANLNFDLCIDSGASSALFGSDGIGLGVGTAVEVSCNGWSGTVVH